MANDNETEYLFNDEVKSYSRTSSFLYHQKELLSDKVRMDAYYNAIFDNKHHFEGKVVLEVGTGSGILAIWAGQAGASKVYAVEASTMANHAQTLVDENNLEDVIDVIYGPIQDVDLPEESVDVIISDWMGPFLLRESMFRSVIYARDNWLKPTGVMYPSHARIWAAPIISEIRDEKRNEYDEAMADWSQFTHETINKYGVDMSVLTDEYDEECKKYYFQTIKGCNIHPDEVIGTAVLLKEIDCSTETIDDIRDFTPYFTSTISVEEETRMCGLAGWFDVQFRGSGDNPAAEVIELSTAPSSSKRNCTHWGQQMLVFDPAVVVSKGYSVSLSVKIC